MLLRNAFNAVVLLTNIAIGLMFLWAIRKGVSGPDRSAGS